MSGRRWSHVAALAVALLAIPGCGSADEPSEPSPVTTAATPAEEPSPTTVAPAPKAAKVKVPDGVGSDYQAAQDLWRAAGLIVAPAEDATGANRIPVLDRNWVVVSQSPKAGSTVDEGSSITATVKKDTDD